MHYKKKKKTIKENLAACEKLLIYFGSRLDFYKPVEQAGFGKGFVSLDHLQKIRILRNAGDKTFSSLPHLLIIAKRLSLLRLEHFLRL